jgi:hypothetical protein
VWKERKGKERKGKERKGKERKGKIWEMRNEKWEKRNEKWEMRNEKWEMRKEKWENEKWKMKKEKEWPPCEANSIEWALQSEISFLVGGGGVVAIDEREDVIKRFSSHFIPFSSLIPMGFEFKGNGFFLRVFVYFPFFFFFSNLKNNGFSYCKVSKVESEGEKGGMVQIQGPTDGIDGIQYHSCPTSIEMVVLRPFLLTPFFSRDFERVFLEIF